MSQAMAIATAPERAEFTSEQSQLIDDVIRRYRGKPGALIPVLEEVQEISGYLPESVQRRVARGLGIPLSQVYGVVTFYSFFTMVPRGRHQIRLCLGTACHVRGGNQVMHELQRRLGIGAGECTKDRRFSIDVVRCLGACGVAPVMLIDEYHAYACKTGPRGPDTATVSVKTTGFGPAPEERLVMTAMKVGSLDDLQAISRLVSERRERYDFRVMVCSGTPCQAAGNLSLKESLLRELENQRLTDRVQVIESGCMGFCAVGPVMTVYPDGYFYQKIKADDIEELVTSHFIDRVPVTRLMYKDEKTGEVIPLVTDLPYIKNQTLLALRNGGHINPEDINDYIYRDGYQGAHAAFSAMKPSDIIAQIKESGLRGRGGGGFPTGLKWEFCSFSKSDKKYVLCNADEGDPGAFMDRSVLESDPHAIIEGMLIAARAIDAHHGYVYWSSRVPTCAETPATRDQPGSRPRFAGREHIPDRLFV